MTHLSRREILVALSGMGMGGLGVPASAQMTAQGTPVRGGTMTITTPSEPSRLQSAIDTGTGVQMIASKMHNGLLNYGADFKPRPELAESWEVAPDGKTITFKLRKGVKWHDGKPFTSADVKFTIEEVTKKLHSRGRGVFANVGQVDAPDPYTAIFRLTQPAPYIMSVLFSAETPMVPKHIYEGKDVLTNPANSAPIGTGPFKFKEWKRGSYIVMERNEDYFEPGKPYLDRIVVRIIPDASARSVAFESGELDLGDSWPVAIPDIQRLATLPNVATTREGSKSWASMDYFEFNLRNPMFQDVRVRRALAHAIDPKFIAESVYLGLARPATGHISQSMEAFYSADKKTYAYDPKMAEKLLDEAGKVKGADGTRFSFVIEPAPFGERFVQTAEYISQALGAVGVKVSVRQQDVGSWLRRVYTTREAQAYNYGIYNMMDPTIGVQRQYWSKSIQDGVPFSNGSGYTNARVDEIFQQALVEPSQAKRRDLFAELQKILANDLPNVPLIMADGVTVYNKRVKGIFAGLAGPFDTQAATWVTA